MWEIFCKNEGFLWSLFKFSSVITQSMELGSMELLFLLWRLWRSRKEIPLSLELRLGHMCFNGFLLPFSSFLPCPMFLYTETSPCALPSFTVRDQKAPSWGTPFIFSFSRSVQEVDWRSHEEERFFYFFGHHLCFSIVSICFGSTQPCCHGSSRSRWRWTASWESERRSEKEDQTPWWSEFIQGRNRYQKKKNVILL